MARKQNPQSTDKNSNWQKGKKRSPVRSIRADNETWYIRKIDSTHFYMANNREALEKQSPSHINGALARHIGEFKGEPYEEDLKEFLRS